VEVKTINISKIEATRRHAGASGRPRIKWNIGFSYKLASDLAAAKTQMNAYNASPGIKRIAYP
jgi:hypothetical protein